MLNLCWPMKRDVMTSSNQIKEKAALKFLGDTQNRMICVPSRRLCPTLFKCNTGRMHFCNLELLSAEFQRWANPEELVLASGSHAFVHFCWQENASSHPLGGYRNRDVRF